MRRLTERSEYIEVDWKKVQRAGEFIVSAAEDMSYAAKAVQKNEVQAAAARLLLNVAAAIEALPGLERIAAAVEKAADEVRPTRRPS